jgi:MFS family permease
MITPPRVAVRRLALGRLISHAGTVAASVALNYEIYQRTNSTGWLAATMLATWGITGLFGPIAGAIGDRFDRKKVMVWCESLAGACWLAIAALDAPVALLGVAFLASLLETPYWTASGGAIPNIAGEEHLAWANGLLSAGNYLGLTIGPLVGGLMVASVGAPWVFLANGLTYGASALLTVSVRAPFMDVEARTAEAEAEHAGLAAGFRFVGRDRVLRLLAVSFGAFILGMAMVLVADPVLAEDFGTGSFGYGLITAFWGGGTVIGSLIGRRVRERDEGRWIVWCSFGVALTAFGIALAPWFWVVLVWSALFGLFDGPTQVVEQNLLQRRTPDVVRSRVMGAWETMFHGALAAALVAGAVLVPIVGPKGAYAIGGVTGLIGSALLLPFLRWLPERPAGGPPASEEPVEESAVPGMTPLEVT